MWEWLPSNIPLKCPLRLYACFQYKATWVKHFYCSVVTIVGYFLIFNFTFLRKVEKNKSKTKNLVYLPNLQRGCWEITSVASRYKWLVMKLEVVVNKQQMSTLILSLENTVYVSFWKIKFLVFSPDLPFAFLKQWSQFFTLKPWLSLGEGSKIAPQRTFGNVWSIFDWQNWGGWMLLLSNE